jgi:hypothetical protein
METETIALLFLLCFWMYVMALAMRTHRLVKNAYEEQYELPVTEIQYGDDHRQM